MISLFQDPLHDHGHDPSARELLLRAACFHGKACHPLFGKPVDPHLLQSRRAQVAAGEAAMPAYLLPAPGHEREDWLIETLGA